MSEKTERELLELAALAAGAHANQWANPGELLPDKGGWVQFIGYGQASIWNPLTDDGDALRLAVKLCIKFDRDSEDSPYACAFATPQGGRKIVQRNDGDIYAATRRAIVRAAAAIGQAREQEKP
jgi:hypothetical protein